MHRAVLSRSNGASVTTRCALAASLSVLACAAPAEPKGESKPGARTADEAGSAPEALATPAATPDRGPVAPDDSTRGAAITEPMDEAAHIYDPAKVHTFDVDIDPSDLASVDVEPAAERYVPARLRFEGQAYDVGYRYKGSVGAFRPPCTANFDGGSKAGKCSVKLSFNWQDPDGQFFGRKKLVFHAMNKDPSMLRERLGYAMFRAMGVPAPRATHAVLRVNGQAEIYALVEEIDGRFTRSRFDEGGEGNLYKEIWPIHDDAQAYLAALETNEDQEPSVDRILRFKRAIEEGPDAMAEWLDLDVVSSYIAVDRVLINDDGAFHFYCLPGGQGNNPQLPGNHNYYWYEAKAEDRFWLVPWDLDNALSESTAPPHIPVDWRTTPSEAECSTSSCRGVDGPMPGCDPVIKNFQAWRAMYEAKIDAFVAGPFSRTAVHEKLDAWREQIVAAGFSVNEAAVAELKGIVDRARVNRGFAY